MQTFLNNLLKWACIAILSIFFIVLNAFINNFFLYIFFACAKRYMSAAEKLCNNWHKNLKHSNEPLLHLLLDRDMNNSSGKKYRTHLGNNNKMEFATNKPIVSVVSKQTYFSCRIKNSEYDLNSELRKKRNFPSPFSSYRRCWQNWFCSC